MDLKAIYLTTLERCAPERLVREHVRRGMPRHVVAIGKCAGALLDGVAAVHDVESAFVAVPEGYRLPSVEAEVHVGGHPHMTPSSFAAGEALLRYVDAHEDILFLVSGGGSACVEVPLVDEDEAMRVNAELVASGKTIGEINAVRRTISAIKGGKLAARVRGRAVTLVYSDVSTGALHDVASGPTVPGSEAVLIADNTTLVQAAAEIIGDAAVVVDEQLERDVQDVAEFLARRAKELAPGEVLVAGGEPTVVVRGDGRGGRCSELAGRFAAISPCAGVFGSSDGVDGSSGVAGWEVGGRLAAGGPAGWQPALRGAARGAARRAFRSALRDALARSDTFAFAAQVGEPIMIAATGNNLRDLFLVSSRRAIR